MCVCVCVCDKKRFWSEGNVSLPQRTPCMKDRAWPAAPLAKGLSDIWNSLWSQIRSVNVHFFFITRGLASAHFSKAIYTTFYQLPQQCTTVNSHTKTLQTRKLPNLVHCGGHSLNQSIHFAILTVTVGSFNEQEHLPRVMLSTSLCATVEDCCSSL